MVKCFFLDQKRQVERRSGSLLGAVVGVAMLLVLVRWDFLACLRLATRLFVKRFDGSVFSPPIFGQVGGSTGFGASSPPASPFRGFDAGG